MDQLVAGYSMGMRKKLALLVALVHDPSVLLLDEPTNGLDPVVAREVRELLVLRARAGGVVLLSTHLLDVAQRVCDRASECWREECCEPRELPRLSSPRCLARRASKTRFSRTPAALSERERSVVRTDERGGSSGVRCCVDAAAGVLERSAEETVGESQRCATAVVVGALGATIMALW